MIVSLFCVLLLVASANLHNLDSSTSPKSQILKDFDEFIKTITKPPGFIDFNTNLRNNNETYQNAEICETCKFVVSGVLQYRKSGINKSLMTNLIKELCVIYSDWGEEACKGYTKLEIDPILYIIDNRPNLTADRVCSIYLQTNLCSDSNAIDWNIKIPDRTKDDEVVVHDIASADPLKILHLTDIHFDSEYVPGSDAVCKEQLCCQSKKPTNPEDEAGFWGDYHVCDMPWHSVLNLMDQIKTQHKGIDSIYFTGDILSHASWKLTRNKNINDIKQIYGLFSKTFNSTPLYPVLGNHEAHPCNFYSPVNISSKVSIRWLFELVANEWSKWLPTDTKETIRKGGYYTVLVKKGFRIIALNSNVCYTSNLWLIYDDVDPYGQLKWLTDTLLESEKNNEYVHILSHVPPGHIYCWKKWSDQFNKIVSRFSNTIKAQFNGHTHLDEIRIFLNEDKTKAINVAYNGASFTTFVGMNPNYRVYDMSDKTYEILDYDNWIFNLTEANKDSNTPPKWFKLYSFKEKYGLNSANNDDLYNWVKRMKTDPKKELLQEYFRLQFRDSAANTAEGCDDKCMNTLLCSITGVNFEDAISC